MKQIDELRFIVREALQKITMASNPVFSEMMKTVDGYRKAEDMILNYAVKNQITITAAIAQLESEMQ